MDTPLLALGDTVGWDLEGVERCLTFSDALFGEIVLGGGFFLSLNLGDLRLGVQAPEEWESVDRKLMVLVAERGEVESTCILLGEFFCRFSGNFLGDNKESGWDTLSV